VDNNKKDLTMHESQASLDAAGKTRGWATITPPQLNLAEQ
jgi:hypothetical protein